MPGTALAYPKGNFPSRVGIGGRWRLPGTPGPRRPPVFRSTKFTGQFRIDGVTRDGTGTSLGSCIVLLFKWSGFHEFVAETTSDGSGNFTFIVGQNPNTFQIVAYKEGAPDLSGTSVNDVVAVQV